MKQLELFKNESKSDELEQMRREWDKTRKALFSRQAEILKMYQELAHEHMMLKLNICRGRLPT